MKEGYLCSGCTLPVAVVTNTYWKCIEKPRLYKKEKYAKMDQWYANPVELSFHNQEVL
jgi:hypothetical protein